MSITDAPARAGRVGPVAAPPLSTRRAAAPGQRPATEPVPWAMFVVAVTALLWVRGGGAAAAAAGVAGPWLAVGQLSGLVAALACLAAVILVARPAGWERRHGLDRMVGWHRWVGITTVGALAIHVVASTVGFAGGDPGAAWEAFIRLLADEPWMVAALSATALFLVVSATSWRRLKSRLPYETWYFVHLNGYVAVLLGVGHQLTVGTTFADDAFARWWWIALFALTAAIVLHNRVGSVARSVLRGPLTVSSATCVARDTVALELVGPAVRRIDAVGGQFVSARFLTRELWWQSHPFSLSAAPDGRTLRLTIKNLGDATALIQQLAPGTKVLLQGPYGCMTLGSEPARPLVLIGAGVGVAPLVALLQSCGPWRRPVVLVRAHDPRDIPHLGELRALIATRSGRLHIITGPRQQWRHGNPFTAHTLASRIPDIAQRAAFVCGPPALQSAAESGLRGAGMPSRHIHSERFGW